MIDPAALELGINDFTDFLLRYFVALAAVGALAMALMELWKKVRASQTRYHGRCITEWLIQSESAFDATRRTDGMVGVSSAAAYSELLQLTTGVAPQIADATATTLLKHGRLPAGFVWVKSRADYALFALSLERMMGHVQDAAESTLNNPRRYPSLYLFFASGADAKDLKQWFEQADMTPQGDAFDRAEAKRRADLYARLHQLVRRKLDGFQLFAEQRWVNWNQLWANVVGALVLFAALAWGRELTSANLPTIVVFSLLGGMLSPVAKDVVVALQRVRRG